MKKREIKFINYKRYIIVIATLLLFLIALNVMFRVSTVFATTYSTTMFVYCVRVFGGLASIIPFSIIELLCYAAAILLLYCIVRLIIELVKNHSKATIHFFTYRLKKYLLNLVCIILACLIIYSANDSLLYHRISFAACANLTTHAHTKDELKKLYLLIENKVNSIAGEVTRDSDGIFTYEGKDVDTLCVDAMYGLRDEYPFMIKYFPRPKKILTSFIMSYTATEGVYSPLTLEANYNRDIPSIDLAHTICHELGHVSGFIHEDEANFIGYVACVNSADVDLQYSGYTTALIYTLNALYSALGGDEYWSTIANLDAQISADLTAQAKFWSKYETKVSEISQEINDTYIKVNGDSEGTARYDMLIELLFEYYAEELASMR